MAKRKHKTTKKRNTSASAKKQKHQTSRRTVPSPEIPVEDAAVASSEEKTCKKLIKEFGFSPDALTALREFRRIHGGGLY